MLLGITLVVLGTAFVLLGLVAAAREVLVQTTAGDERGEASNPEAWAKLLSALAELIRVAPQWFMLVLVGMALIGFGSSRL